jgi:DNA-directed RNA polymerase subunit RPC12/RpoP
MPGSKRQALKLVDAPAQGAVVTAPPIITTSSHSVDYCCAHCGTTLLHSEPGQINNLVIRCTQCGSYNSTDVA